MKCLHEIGEIILCAAWLWKEVTSIYKVLSHHVLASAKSFLLIVSNHFNVVIPQLLYISVQGQQDSNRFILNIWDSLFQQDEYKYDIHENLPAGRRVTIISSHVTGYT